MHDQGKILLGATMVGENNIIGKTMPWLTYKSRASVKVRGENHKDMSTKRRNW